VWTPATTEAFATYGTLDDSAPVVHQPVALPGQIVPQIGGLDVQVSSTNLQSLTDAFLYIVHYPYECAEQRSSRIASIAALRDVLAAFHARGMPSAAALATSMANDFAHLIQMQGTNGGFSFWGEPGATDEPYLSVFVANALARAAAKGYDVPSVLLSRAKPYLEHIALHLPATYGADARRSIAAFALYTRKLLGIADLAQAHQLIADAGGADQLQPETLGWLLGALAGNPAAAADRAAIVHALANRVTETAGIAHFVTSYGDAAHVLLASDARTDAVVLEALIKDDPKSDLIPELVAGLLAARRAGTWASTQEDAFVLLALDRYFQTFEQASPHFVARVWLGADSAGDHAFAGHTTETQDISIPMAQVASHDHQDLVIERAGAGRAYYRIGMTYAPQNLHLDPADRGFVVERTYAGVDDIKDAVRAADGSWHVKAGARIRVSLTMVAESRRYHVALVDPLPAGFEPLDPALATTGALPASPAASAPSTDDWLGTWYDHQNLRDERVEAFASEVGDGVHDYAYLARATTRGTFEVAPAHAEEMYAPETFGRSASDRVIVE
jgi:hypothetical protein